MPSRWQHNDMTAKRRARPATEEEDASQIAFRVVQLATEQATENVKGVSPKRPRKAKAKAR
jgi:hypothetical protein